MCPGVMPSSLAASPSSSSFFLPFCPSLLASLQPYVLDRVRLSEQYQRHEQPDVQQTSELHVPGVSVEDHQL